MEFEVTRIKSPNMIDLVKQVLNQAALLTQKTYLNLSLVEIIHLEVLEIPLVGVEEILSGGWG